MQSCERSFNPKRCHDPQVETSILEHDIFGSWFLYSSVSNISIFEHCFPFSLRSVDKELLGFHFLPLMSNCIFFPVLDMLYNNKDR